MRDHTLHESLPPHGPMYAGARLCDGNQDKRCKQSRVHGSLKASVPNKGSREEQKNKISCRVVEMKSVSSGIRRGSVSPRRQDLRGLFGFCSGASFAKSWQDGCRQRSYGARLLFITELSGSLQ